KIPAIRNHIEGRSCCREKLIATGILSRHRNCCKIPSALIKLPGVTPTSSLRSFHEGFVLKRLPYVPHERNCLHLGEQRGTTDVFKAHRKHPFRSIDGHRVEHATGPVEGEGGFVALYDVLNRELHYEITRADIVPVRLFGDTSITRNIKRRPLLR